MALPSQTERQTEIGRSYVYGKRTVAGNGTKKALIAAAVLVLAAGGFWAVVTFANRRSATGTLPPTDLKTDSRATPVVTPTKSENHTTTPGTVAPASSMGASPITNAPALLPPTSISQASPTKITPAGGTGPSTVKADPATTPVSPSSTPTSTPTTPPSTSPTSTAPSDSAGRPSAVDVTRRDLTPSPTPVPTSGPGNGSGNGTGSGGTNGTTGQPSSSLVPTGSTGEVMQLIQSGEQRAASGDLVQARVILSKALRNPNAVREDQERIRQKLTAINADLLYSPKIVAGDPMSEEYVVKSGDNLIKITRNRELAIDWRLLERINGVKGNTLRIGQKLKVVRGPFHAIVHKGDYRLDLFQGSPDDPDSWIYIRSFKVGLGTGNSTPIGNFVIKPRSKLVNPPWVNPQTGQKFGADDPKNPIGEYWMGIEGVGESKAATGYGLHGTIEPDSIGQQKSMGCVRLGDEDIKLLYEMLVEQISVVKIVP